jgi:1,4-dihydroxy-2-naphthoyl-CoA hydrolase
MSDAPPVVIPVDRTLEGTLGFELLDVSEELARARIPVEDRVKQPMGLVHGGVYAAAAESLASFATWQAVAPQGMVAMGMSNLTSFLRPITDGTIHVEARRRHRGRTTWVWEVDCSDDEGNLCAVTRVTTAIRPAPRKNA